jgi:hypothetical protein
VLGYSAVERRTGRRLERLDLRGLLERSDLRVRLWLQLRIHQQRRHLWQPGYLLRLLRLRWHLGQLHELRVERLLRHLRRLGIDQLRVGRRRR